MTEFHHHFGNHRGSVSMGAPLGPKNRIAHGIDHTVPNLQIETYTANYTGAKPSGRLPYVFQTPYAVTLPQSAAAYPPPYYHSEMFKPPLFRNSRLNGFRMHTHYD